MLQAMLAEAGLRIEATDDATRATHPSYGVVAAGAMPTGPLSSWPATYVLRLLHDRGVLSYHLVSARRRAGGHP